MYFDITRTLSPTLAVFPGDTPFSLATLLSLANGDSCNLTAITTTAHAGTHVDGELHYAAGAPGVDAVPLDILIGRARLVTLVVERSIALPDVAALDLVGVERLLVRTGSSAVPDDVFNLRAVYFEPDAAEYLGARGIRLIGTDAPSVDATSATDLIAHRAFHAHRVIIAENLQFDGVPDGDYELILLPIKIRGGDGAPARAVLRAG